MSDKKVLTTTIQRSVNLIARAVSSVDFRVTDDKYPSTGTQLKKLLNVPNGKDSLSSIIYKLVTDYLYTGNAFLLMSKGNKDLLPKELWYLRSYTMSVVEVEDGTVESYRQTLYGREQKFKTSHVIHWKYPDIKSDWYGDSPLTKLGIIVRPHLPGQITYNNDIESITPQIICNIFNIPCQMLGISGVDTFNTYEEARAYFWSNAVAPLVKELTLLLNNFLVPFYGSDSMSLEYVLPGFASFTAPSDTTDDKLEYVYDRLDGLYMPDEKEPHSHKQVESASSANSETNELLRELIRLLSEKSNQCNTSNNTGPKVVGKKETDKNKAECRFCGSVVEYRPDHVKSCHGKDISGGSDGQEWVDCPCCSSKIVLRSW